MQREFSASGLTTNPATMSPGPGYKWRIKFVLAYIKEGATAGTRTIQLYVVPGGNSLGLGFAVIKSANSTNVSELFVSAAAPFAFSLPGATDTNSVVSLSGAEAQEICEKDVLTFGMVLVAGDTFGYIILLDEEVA